MTFPQGHKLVSSYTKKVNDLQKVIICSMNFYVLKQTVPLAGLMI